jgi:hypothetical protein
MSKDVIYCKKSRQSTVIVIWQDFARTPSQILAVRAIVSEEKLT